jgi:hypothetical protein
MTEKERDNAAEQQARAEENKQETEQLLKRKRWDIPSANLMLGILSAYLLFVTAVAAVSVIAFYTQHGITLKILFVVCILLLSIVPIGLIWYLLAFLPRKKPTEKVVSGKQKLLRRFMQSRMVMLVARVGNNRIFKLFNFGLCIYNIANQIRTFPLHPRFSLAIIVFNLAGILLLVGFIFMDRILDLISENVNLIVKTFDIVSYTYGVAEGSRKYIEGTEPSHNGEHKAIANALRAIHNTTQVLADTMHPPNPRNQRTPLQK